MGGVNHQPCGRYLANSTLLSRCLSTGIIQLESANIAFEDLILSELTEKPGRLTDVTSRLGDAISSAQDIIFAIDRLTQQMDEANYEDLPPLRRLNVDAVGKDFLCQGMVCSEAWHEMSALARSRGFYGIFRHFRGRAEELIQLTSQLRTSFLDLMPEAKTGTLSKTLEENHPGNVRPVFAQTYSAWYKFHADFLASSLLSSEVWYSFNGYGSMTSGQTARLVAV